jgi:hypothetical protein
LLVKGPFRTFGAEELREGFARVLDLDLPPLSVAAPNGLPSEFVAQGVRIVRREVGPDFPIYAGIGLDVPEPGLLRPMEPVDVEHSVAAAIRAGADGIVVSRNYAEMNLRNLAAVGDTIRGLMRDTGQR